MTRNHLAAVLLTAMLADGCATVFQGSRQKVHIQSDPTSAQVEVDGMAAGKTPLTVPLRRGKSHSIQVSSAGYRERSLQLDSTVGGGWIVLDILLGGIIGVVVDAATSNWESFDGTVSLRLNRDSTQAVPAIAEEAPAEATEGMLRLQDDETVIFPLDGGAMIAKLLLGYHKRDVELRFRGGIRADHDEFGTFSSERVTLHKDSEIFVRTPAGRVAHLEITSIDPEGVEIEWRLVQVSSLEAPVSAGADSAMGGLLRLQDDQATEFPVDGGILRAQLHRVSVDLVPEDGLAIGAVSAGPFVAYRKSLKVGDTAFVLTPGRRVVRVRLAELHSREATIEWLRL